MYKINSKTVSRIAAIQVFYQYQVTDNEIDLLTKEIIALYKNHELSDDTDDYLKYKIKPSLAHLYALITLTKEHITTIDQLISKHLVNDSTISAIPMLLLALLRIAVCELCYFVEIPRKVVINEYTDIASDMLCEQDVGFVNFILDNIQNTALLLTEL